MFINLNSISGLAIVIDAQFVFYEAGIEFVK
jgi:hypothetical protein